MMILNKKQKQRLILGGILTAFLIVFIVLCIAVSKKNSKLKAYKNELKNVELVVDSLKLQNKVLGDMSCITVNCTFEVTNKNIFAVSNTVATQIARETAALTKKEVISALDTLNKIK